MMLRPYQKRLVDAAVNALAEHGNTLAVAATGAGKTVCLAAIAQRLGGRQLILQHRRELVRQNMEKYRAVNPDAAIGLWTAETKTFRRRVTFAMAQSLAGHAAKIPALDVVFVDEAHHCAAPTWERIISAAREKNPDVRLVGFTATPRRSDRKALRRFFDNICDVVDTRELVALGFLVPPRAFVPDVLGTAEALARIRGASDFGEQQEVAAILDTVAVSGEVIRHWRDRAEGRPTVAFCATVAHAESLAAAFSAAGIPALAITGAMSAQARQAALDAMTAGKIRVLANCMVLTEGWDYPPVSCVVLLRRASSKSPLIQMIGRGLRAVDPRLFPGVVKKDCVVLDFGQSLLVHPDITTDARLDAERERAQGDAVLKTCPEEYRPGMPWRFPDSAGQTGCGARVPAQTKTCPLCGFQFESLRQDDAAVHVELTEMDILGASPFRYVDLFGTGMALMASGFEAWAAVMSADGGETWRALGKRRRGNVESIMAGGRLQAIAAADDYLRHHETDGTAKKSKRWLDDPATEKQVALLNGFGYGLRLDLLGQSGMNKYAAACHMNFQFARHSIERALGVAS